MAAENCCELIAIQKWGAEKVLQEWLQCWCRNGCKKEMLLKIAANKGYLRENCCKNGWCGKNYTADMAVEKLRTKYLQENCWQKWLRIMAAEKLLRKWLAYKNGCCRRRLLMQEMAAKRDAAENCCEQRIYARKLLQEWLRKNYTADMAVEKSANKYLQEDCCKNGCI